MPVIVSSGGTLQLHRTYINYNGTDDMIQIIPANAHKVNLGTDQPNYNSYHNYRHGLHSGINRFHIYSSSGRFISVAKKLNRDYIGIEIDKEYIPVIIKRLNNTFKGDRIQGYKNGVFWERNSNT